jgi:ornithine--oxo-acid transaminase
MCIIVDKAEGVWVYGESGRRYLDCQTAYNAVLFGHDHPRITKAITKQAK